MKRWLLAGLVWMSAGCGYGGTGPSGPRIIVVGRIERSAPLSLSLVDDGDTIPAAQVTWQVAPSGAASLTADSAGLPLLIPLTTGRLTLTAETGGKQVSRALTVKAPPSIVFALLDSTGNRDIWRVALDGQDAMRLTEDPADDRQPTATTSRVIFVSARPAGSGLYSVSPTGGTTTPLLLSSADLTYPALSRSGGRLAFASTETGAPKIWVANQNGSGARRLAPNFGFEGAVEGYPAWSPDGKRLALMSTDPGEASIFRIDSSGANPVPLIDTVTAFQPSWSPDGASIVFAASPAGTTELYIVPAAGGAPVPLTHRTDGGEDSEPAWLPDGRIVYRASLAAGGAELRWVDPASPDHYEVIPLPTGDPSTPKYLPS